MILLKKKVNKLRTRTILGDVDGDDDVDEKKKPASTRHLDENCSIFEKTW